MFEVKKLTKQYGTEFALNEVSLSIGKGMNFIVGASGSGKTTLLKILCGMETEFDGDVIYQGKDISTFSSKERSVLYNQSFGFVWQDFHLLEEATVLENVLLPGYLKEGKNCVSANQILRQLKIEDLQDKKVKFLSGGQKQRVAIARELMKNPQVIFCDEPTSALDAEAAKATIEILRALSNNRIVIVVTHDTSLITEKDKVFELDKGELLSVPTVKSKKFSLGKMKSIPNLALKNAFQIALINTKNRVGRFAVSVISLVIAATLLLTVWDGAISSKGQSEFDKLLETYGERILNIDIVGSFTGAGGTDSADENKPNGDVTQDISGLYEKYQEDERVEFIVCMQPFENIKVTLDEKTYSVKGSGNAPMLTRLVAGGIPSGEKASVIVPLALVNEIGLTPETAIGKEIDFSAEVYKWVNGQPVSQPVQMKATVCGVADNTVVYDYQGHTESFTVDDSFFFNKAGNEELRRQADIQNENANFTIRAKSPEAMISLKDELNKNGIVPLGQFELMEDMVRLNQQTTEQSGSASTVIGILALVLVFVVFAMTSFLRKREYAIYKVSGYHNGHLSEIAAAEATLNAVIATIVMLAFSPILNMVTKAMFGATILSFSKLVIGVLFIFGAAVVAFAAGFPGYGMAKTSAMLNEGAKS